MSSPRATGHNPRLNLIMSWIALLVIGILIGWAIGQDTTSSRTPKNELQFHAAACDIMPVLDGTSGVQQTYTLLRTTMGQILVANGTKLEPAATQPPIPNDSKLRRYGIYDFTVRLTQTGPYQLLSFKRATKTSEITDWTRNASSC